MNKAFLDLLFNKGEHVSATPNKLTYFSVDLKDLHNDTVLLKLKNSKTGNISETEEEVANLKLVSINPILPDSSGSDDNCTAYRTFLIELDDGDLKDQLKYVKDMGMPYSACVFSGGKSLHFAITLSEDLPSIDLYRYYSRWILRVMSEADQNTVNPSRKIRIPGAMRDGVEQRLVYLGSRISLEELNTWLSEFEGLRPKITQKQQRSSIPDINRISKWVLKELRDGIDTSKGRNARWFAIATEFGLAGYGEDDTVQVLEDYFTEERDFTRREWEYCVRHAIRRSSK